MKYLSRIVCGVTLAGSVASCAVSAEPAPVQSTTEAVSRDLTELFKMADALGKSIVLVRGTNIACACGPIANPNGPGGPGPGPPPQEYSPAAVERTIQALQAMQRAAAAGRNVTVQTAAVAAGAQH